MPDPTSLVLNLVGQAIMGTYHLIETNKTVRHELDDLVVNVKAVEKSLEPIKKKNIEQLEEGYRFVLESLLQCLEAINQTLEALQATIERRKRFPFNVLGITFLNAGGVLTDIKRHSKKLSSLVSVLILSETTIMMNGQTLTKSFRVSNVLANEETRRFWSNNFGSNKFSVPWDRFTDAFQNVFGKQDPKHIALLKSAIDSNNDGLISCYELSHFTDALGLKRAFQQLVEESEDVDKSHATDAELMPSLNTIYIEGAQIVEVDKGGKIRLVLEKVGVVSDVLQYDNGVLVQVRDKEFAELCGLLDLSRVVGRANINVLPFERSIGDVIAEREAQKQLTESTILIAGATMEDLRIDDNAVSKALHRIGKITTSVQIPEGLVLQFDDPLCAEVALMLQLNAVLKKVVTIQRFVDSGLPPSVLAAAKPHVHSHLNTSQNVPAPSSPSNQSQNQIQPQQPISGSASTSSSSLQDSPASPNVSGKRKLEAKGNAFGRDESAERAVQAKAKQKYNISKGTISPEEMAAFYQDREKYRQSSDLIYNQLVELSFPPDIAKKAATANQNNDLDAAIDFCVAWTVPLPHGWSVSTDRFGRVYYKDHNTRSTTYTPPLYTPGPLPQHWKPSIDEKGRTIFVNTETQQKTYVRPQHKHHAH